MFTAYFAIPQVVVQIRPPVVMTSNEERVVGGIGLGGGGRHPGAMVTAGPSNFLVAVGFSPPLIEVAIGEVVGAALCYAGGAHIAVQPNAAGHAGAHGQVGQALGVVDGPCNGGRCRRPLYPTGCRCRRTGFCR